MAKPKQKPTYIFRPIPARKNSERYSVTVRHPDGRVEAVGSIENIFIRHMNRRGWEATGRDGHRAVHDAAWQAAWALTWDGKGYPFPVAQSHQFTPVFAN